MTSVGALEACTKGHPCQGDIYGGHRMLSTPAPGVWHGRGGQSHGRCPCRQCLPLSWDQLQRAVREQCFGEGEADGHRTFN